MPTAVGLQLIKLKYISQSDPQVNSDSLHVQFPTRFTTASFNLATNMNNVRAGHYFTFTSTAIPAPSSS